MSGWAVPLAEFSLREGDLDAVVETYRSGWLTMGPRTEELEESFARYTGAAFAVAVTNGTAALHLMALAAGLGPGDDVLVPALTFVATANAVAYTGARPVLADIADATSPWLSPSSCERALTPRTRAVLHVSYGGHPGDLQSLRAWCDSRGLILLEDAAHSAGSRLHGRHLGTFGLAGAFSMFSNKNLAVGEGGVLVTDDHAVAARARLLRSHGMTTGTWDRHRRHAASYDVVDLGFNYRIDEPRAALATSRLARLDDENARRARLAEQYRSSLDGRGLQFPLMPVPDLTAANHLFPVVLPNGVERDRVQQHLEGRGVQSSVHYPALHRTSLYSARNGDRVELSAAEQYSAHELSLPLFAWMTVQQQRLVVDALHEALAEQDEGAA